MKRQHLLLILLPAGTAAYFFNENRRPKAVEAIASGELQLLRDAVKKPPGTATASAPAGKSSRPPGIDTTKFIAGLTDILKAGPSPESQQKMREFMTAYGPQLKSAPLPKLKEICDLIEKNFPFDQAGTEGGQFFWYSVVGGAAKYDPAWAFAKYDQAASTCKIPLNMQLKMFKELPALNEERMSPGYAAALQKWLDAALAAGRIQDSDPLVAALRADIAAVQGNQPAAIQQISQMPRSTQEKAAIEYVQQLQTTDARRQAVEQLSTALTPQNFSAAVRVLASQHGFDAAREVLRSRSLTPEKHDVAAASIASANIGPGTKDRAAWLLENLRSDDGSALDEFTSKWTERNHPEAANWIKAIPPGPKRDAALKGFIPVAARIDGATAMDWALTVSDPLLRNQLYCGARGKWEETNAGQANEYSKAHPLDREAIRAASK